jgi:hypothetical protein
MPKAKPDQTQEQQDTTTLRSMWTHAAAGTVQQIRSGDAVHPAEVERLQKTLEGIETREDIDKLNAIARGRGKGRRRARTSS